MRTPIFLFLISFGLKVSACECHYDFSEFTPYYLLEYNRIFTGKTLKIDTIGRWEYRVTVVSYKTYWGKTKDTVYLRTYDGGMCGYSFDLNTEYLFYAYGKDSSIISMCSPTRPLYLTPENFFIPTDRDSMREKINGIYKNYSVKYVVDYLKNTQALELSILDTISQIKSGALLTKFINGIPSGILHFQNGQLRDTVTLFFPDRRIKSVGVVKANAKSGLWKEYTLYVNGLAYVKNEGVYIDNERHGVWQVSILTGKKILKKSHPGLADGAVDYK
ncbi:MAG: hypothetical protein ACXVPN_03950 [Bacteroidia bacterium]